MPIKDRIENLTNEQKIYLLQIVEDIRKIDDFAKNYPFKDDYFDESDPFYNIDSSFCMHSYTNNELIEVWFNPDMLARVPNIDFALAVVEEDF